MREAFTVPIVAALLGACIFGVTIKLVFIGTVDSSDYQEYVASAQYIRGESNEAIPHRLLKPLLPLTLAALGFFFDYETATIVQAVFFYFALAFAMYGLAYLFLRERIVSFLITLLCIFSYPILKYGVELNSETGAIFFYTLSLLLSARFAAHPTINVFILNAVIVTAGFFWKEYSVVAAIIFGLVILGHHELHIRQKVRYVLAYAAIFLIAHVPYQIYMYVTQEYSYVSWYKTGVSGAIKQNEFTLKNIVKSTAALLGIAWIAVPFGLRIQPAWRRRFLYTSALPPFIAYTWGYVSSRLLFVMAPPFFLRRERE